MTDQVTPQAGDLYGYGLTAEVFLGPESHDWYPAPFAHQRLFGHLGVHRRIFEQNGSWAAFLKWIDTPAAEPHLAKPTNLLAFAGDTHP